MQSPATFTDKLLRHTEIQFLDCKTKMSGRAHLLKLCAQINLFGLECGHL